MNSAPPGSVMGKPAANAAAAQEVAPHSRSAAVLFILTVCGGLICAAFLALGTWQIKRLAWKLDLIERVEQRAHAPAVVAPGPDRWALLNAQADEYRRVRLSGSYLYELTTRVQASTELGSGFWLLTPLRRADGSVVLVNRGFIPGQTRGQPARVDASASNHTAHTAVVTGLLRMSEPGGGFLRDNDPATNRWYSRDVQAIAAARGLSQVAPYFVDADAAKASASGDARASSPDSPVGGLTVIAFHNNHLVYALTWYALALMAAGACCWVLREERKLRRGVTDTGTDRSD